MASGNTNKQAEAANKKAIEALTPKNYSDPYGSFNGQTGVFSPNLTEAQKQTRETELNKINSIVGGLPSSSNTQDLFNNDYYNTFSNYYNNTLNSQREKDQKTLSNTLSARNQLGSSYDAYNQNLLNKQYSDSALAAEAQARGDSANYYTQNLTNQLNTLAGLRTDQINSQTSQYQPFQNYLGYQGAVAPLQQGQAQAYQNLANYYVANPTFSLGQKISQFYDPLNTMGFRPGGFGSNGAGQQTASAAINALGSYGGGTTPQTSATTTGNNTEALKAAAQLAFMFA